MTRLAAHDLGLRPSMTARRAMTSSPGSFRHCSEAKSFRHQIDRWRLPLKREQLSNIEYPGVSCSAPPESLRGLADHFAQQALLGLPLAQPARVVAVVLHFLAQHGEGLKRLREKLANNQAAILAHLNAVSEVATLMQKAIQHSEADGTYSSGEFGWAR